MDCNLAGGKAVRGGRGIIPQTATFECMPIALKRCDIFGGRIHSLGVRRLSPLRHLLYNRHPCSPSCRQGTDDQHFMVSYSHDSRHWTPPSHLELRSGSGCMWSPSLFRTQDTIVLFYSESSTCRRPVTSKVRCRFPTRRSEISREYHQITK